MIYKKDTLVELLFVSIFITLGLFIYKDYAISADEEFQRLIGLVNFKYIVNLAGLDFYLSRLDGNIPELSTHLDADHGAIFELFCVFVEKTFDITNTKQIYELKHFIIFITFVTGCYATYSLVVKQYGYRWLGLLAVVFLITSPRIFAEAFYNSKDIVFMSLFVISVNTMFNFYQNKNLKNLFCHALACSIAIDVRLQGIVIPIVSISIIILELFINRTKIYSKILYITIFIFTLIIFIIVFWPWLWIDPIGNFTLALKNMAHFPRQIAWILYRSHYYTTDGLPWHYIIVFIFITTPIIYLIFSIIGALGIFFNLLKNKFYPFGSKEYQTDWILLLLIIGPISGVILLKSVLYDGWRHFYFIYPAVVIIAARGFQIGLLFFKKPIFIKYLYCSILFISIALSIKWIVESHPYQNVYFNSMIGKNWITKYHVDYWGLSSKEAVQYIINNDQDPTLKIKPFQDLWPGPTLNMLSTEEKSRFRFVNDLKEADYVIFNYRFFSPNDQLLWKGHPFNFYKIHDIKVNDEIIMSIFKRNASFKVQ